MLTSPNAQEYGGFGISVAASGSLVVVGAFGEGAGAGQAYLYNTEKGSFTTLSSPSPQAGGNFGYSVAASGNFVVVGEWGDTVDSIPGAGQAYVYNTATNTYTLLTNPSPTEYAAFGFSVAASGSIVVVGAPDLSLSTPGAAYIFNAKTGALVTTLSSPNPLAGGQFGFSVATDGDTVLVGAPTETGDGLAYDGNAYIYSTGSLKYMTLTNPDRQTNCDPNAQSFGDFGYSVAISNNKVIVGAIANAVNGHCDAGNAYTFNANNGKFMQTLTSPNAQTGGYFGEAVAVNNNAVTVGASGEHSNAGNAYTFNADSGKLMQTFTSPNSQTNGYFGSAVAVNGGTLIVGANAETAMGYPGAGNSYLFDAQMA